MKHWLWIGVLLILSGCCPEDHSKIMDLTEDGSKKMRVDAQTLCADGGYPYHRVWINDKNDMIVGQRTVTIFVECIEPSFP